MKFDDNFLPFDKKSIQIAIIPIIFGEKEEGNIRKTMKKTEADLWVSLYRFSSEDLPPNPRRLSSTDDSAVLG